MRVAIFGTGYVGLVTGTCLAEVGHHVICVDIDQAKVDGLNRGVIPIYEPGLEPMVKGNHASGRLRFTTDAAEAIAHGEITFIAVGTPPDEDGSADLQYVLAVARTVGRHIDGPSVIVNKSTVPVRTADKVRAAIQEELDARGVDHEFDVVSNPEFLKEGDAVADCMRPDRIVIGAKKPAAIARMRRLYAPFNRNRDRIVEMDVRSAELTKYAANAMLATKISFMNEIANIAERVGADVEHVRNGIGSDPRIGWHFIYPVPATARASRRCAGARKTAHEYGMQPTLLNAVESVNNAQKGHLFELVQRHYADGNGSIAGKTFAVWGLAFKPNTDDMRAASSRRLMASCGKPVPRCARTTPKPRTKPSASSASATTWRSATTPSPHWKRRRAGRGHRVEAVPQPGFRQDQAGSEGRRRVRRPQPVRPAGDRSRRSAYYAIGRGRSLHA
uniref:UDP-glucose 6-dehydrogenase n=1 Tax=Xanthomonas campestris TaxID=339 RepID=Q56812_XANCA|nr:UDP-glucose dehydrogenase [Xanthomonas campestris]